MWRIHGQFYCFDSEEQYINMKPGRAFAESVVDIPDSVRFSDEEMNLVKALQTTHAVGLAPMQLADRESDKALDRMVSAKIRERLEYRGKYVVVKHPYWYEKV